MNSKQNLFWIFLCCFLLYSGCGSPPPSELGELYPVKITVVDQDTPLEGVRVTLVKKNTTSAWGCAGTSDKHGVAVITTSTNAFSGKGVPGGVYTITLGKTPPFPKELEPQQEEDSLPNREFNALQKKRKEFLEQNRIIPEILEAAKTSPIEMTIEKDSGTMSVDISKYTLQRQ